MGGEPVWRLKQYRGYWYAVARIDGRTVRKSLRTKDRAAAERALIDAQKGPEPDTVGEIVAGYIAEREHTATSIDRIRYAWGRAGGVFGEIRPDQITRDLCRSYTKRRAADGVSAGTIRKELEVIRTALRWANKHREAQFEFPPKPQPKDRWLTKEEIERLIDAAQAPHVRLFIEIAWRTAARSSAILGLRWDRVDLAGRRISFGGTDTKRRKPRATVPVNASLLESLTAAYEARTTEYVIEYGGKPVKSIKHGFANACERAGLEGVTPHVLRHSAATHMAMARVPMPEIAAFLGHSDSRTTERIYAKYSPEYLQGAAAALE